MGAALARLALEAKERGNTAYRNADCDDAVLHYTRAVSLAEVPSAAVSTANRATLVVNRSAALLSQGNFEAALADAEAGSRLDPGNAKAHYRKAQALLGLGQPAEAAAGLRSAVQRLPEERALTTLLEQVEARPPQE